jgi:hypothetical protein
VLKFTAAVGVLLHNDWLATACTVAVGLTVIVNVIVVPVQVTPAFVYTGVTVTVATNGAVVLFVAENDPILPLPLAAKPIDGVLFTQLNTTLLPPLPLLGLLKFIAVLLVPLHNTWLATVFTVAVGLTVIVNVIGVPTQLMAPLVKVGVTVIVATIGAVVALVAIKVGMLPVPLAAIPIEGVLLTQL